MLLPGGRAALASVRLLGRESGKDGGYAYLRFKTGNATVTRYLGPVTAVGRSAQLAEAWELARGKGYVRDRGTDVGPPRL